MPEESGTSRSGSGSGSKSSSGSNPNPRELKSGESSSSSGSKSRSTSSRSSGASGSGSRSGPSRPEGGSGSGSGSSSKSRTSGGADLLSRSRDFRRTFLTPSGGWLHDVVVGASSVTGVSDYFLLGVIFIGAWVVLRLAEREISLILGLGFDLTIPLQHSMSGNKSVADRHRQHLERYWPIFLMGTALEFGCLFLVHPTLFTLVVCLKTTACTTVWFAQVSDLNPSINPASDRLKNTSNPELTTRPQPPASSQEDKEAKKTMQAEFAKLLKEKGGFKSVTACNMLARQVCKEPDHKAMEAKIAELVSAPAEKKAEMEVQAKKDYEEMKAARK